jgi:shikimate dehydrogenase
VRAAVLGQPIAHSRSPLLHNAAYQALGLHDWTYTAIECDEEGLPGLVASLGQDWAGLSLTMPLKRAVLPLLDEADPLVAAVGGANTVLFTQAGRVGHNTDVPGMVAALAAIGIVKADSATILGAGATASAALAALRELGLTEAVVLARDQARAAGLLAAAARLGVTCDIRPFEAGPRSGDLVISTLPAAAEMSLRSWPPVGELSAVFDVVYHPWPTPLAAAALTAGVPVASGFDLLLHQAARQVELMTGHTPAPLPQMRAALAAASCPSDARDTRAAA